MSTCACSFVSAIPISLPKPLTKWLSSPPDVFSLDTTLNRCLDLTTNNIIVFPHVVFDEVDSPFSASSRLTNDLEIFLQDDDSLGAGLMPTPLPVPCIPSGFLPLVIAGNKTAHLGSQTTARTDAGGPTVRPGKQTTPGTEASGLTMQPSDPSAP
jgi:hypothetical protein